MSSLDWLHTQIVTSIILAYGVGCIGVQALMVASGWWDE